MALDFLPQYKQMQLLKIQINFCILFHIFSLFTICMKSRSEGIRNCNIITIVLWTPAEFIKRTDQSFESVYELGCIFLAKICNQAWYYLKLLQFVNNCCLICWGFFLHERSYFHYYFNRAQARSNFHVS